MQPVILYRNLGLSSDEVEIAAAEAAGFRVLKNRVRIGRDELVVGRYSVIPYFVELEEDLNLLGSRLINSKYEHAYVADLQNWANDLGDLTPETWTRLEDLPEEGPFIVKGETNSRKHDWKKLMFAETKKQALDIAWRLSEDGLIGSQKIYVRKYVPLKTFMVGLNDLPITNEFRFFVCYGRIISGGYYWSSYVEELASKPDASEVPQEFLQTAIERIGNKINFYALDVAQTAEGNWIVIELNDGQMSGLSENDPSSFYANLKLAIEERKNVKQ
jgi:hypothetical protein